MINFTSKKERGTILGDQDIYWTVMRNPGFLSPLDQAIQAEDTFRLLKTQGFIRALETEQDSVLTFLTTKQNISLILNTMLHDIQAKSKNATGPSETHFTIRETEDNICAVDTMLQTARFGTRFYDSVLKSKELPRFLCAWIESNMYLNPRQASRFASFIKNIVWHESRRMKFIELLSSTFCKLKWDRLLMCICNRHMVDSLVTVFQTCMPLDDTDDCINLSNRTSELIIPHFQINEVLEREINHCINQDNISYVEAMRFECLCAFISEMIHYNHPLLQSHLYDCVCTLAAFLFQGGLIIATENEHIYATLEAVGETVVVAMSFLMRSTHSYLRKNEVVAEVQSLVYQYSSVQEPSISKKNNKTPLMVSGKKTRAMGMQVADNSFSVNSTITGNPDFGKYSIFSGESSKKVSRLASPSIRRSPAKDSVDVDTKDEAASLPLTKLQPAVLDKLQSMIPHESVLSVLWKLFSDENHQLVQYLYVNYVRYILHFYEEGENHLRRIRHAFESISPTAGLSSSDKSISDHEIKLDWQLADYIHEKDKSSRSSTASSRPGADSSSNEVSRTPHTVSNISQIFSTENTEAIHTIGPIVDSRDRSSLYDSQIISHFRSFSYAGKGNVRNPRRIDMDTLPLSNNSFSNIYRLSNQYGQSYMDQIFASEDNFGRQRKYGTRSKPIKPKKLLSRYNPFLKQRKTDSLRGLQGEMNQTCQLFLNKTPDTLSLSLTIRLRYLTRILSLVSDVRCQQYSILMHKEPVSAFNNSVRQPDDSMGYIASYSAELPPTADCGCGGPSEMPLRDVFVFYDHYQMPYSPLELSAQLLKMGHLFPLIDCLGPIYRNSHTLNMLGSRVRQCALDLSTFYPELFGVLFPVSVERYDSFTAAIAMSSSPELRRSTFCVHLLSSVRAMLRKAAGISDDDFYRSRFTQLQTFASALNIASAPNTGLPVTPVVSSKRLRGFTDSQLGREAKKGFADSQLMVQSPLQTDKKPSRSILSICGRSDRYQNSSIDFTQSELISIGSPTQQRQPGKQEMRLPSNNVEESSSSFTGSFIVEWENASSPGLSSPRKKKAAKPGLILNVQSDIATPAPLREVTIPWTVQELFDIIRSSKISGESIDWRCLDVCMRRTDVQLLNRLYLSTACKQRGFADDHNNFMSTIVSYSNSVEDNDQQNIFTESVIMKLRERKQKARKPKVQVQSPTVSQAANQREISFDTTLSDSVVRINGNSLDRPQKLSITGSTIRLSLQSKDGEEPNVNAQCAPHSEESDDFDMLRDICDEKI